MSAPYLDRFICSMLCCREWLSRGREEFSYCIDAPHVLPAGSTFARDDISGRIITERVTYRY